MPCFCMESAAILFMIPILFGHAREGWKPASYVGDALGEGSMISHTHKRGDSARDLVESEEHIRKHSLYLVSAKFGRILNTAYR
jgi:hypothetical protein